MRIVPLIALAAATFAPHAAAHGDLPHKDWCDGGTATFIAEFKLSAKDIAGSAARSSTEECPEANTARSTDRPGAGPKILTCGQFDPPYSQARTAGQRHCSRYALPTQGSSPDYGTTAAIARGPASYVDARHHEIYRVDDGLHGECVICLPPGT